MSQDLMRRMVKENLLKFDGNPTVPRAKSHIPCRTSFLMAEAHLYKGRHRLCDPGNSIALKHFKTTSAPELSDSHSQYCKGDSLRHPRRFTNLFAGAGKRLEKPAS